jgi:hypothetical protein
LFPARRLRDATGRETLDAQRRFSGQSTRQLPVELMSAPTDPNDENFDSASAQLSDGLKSCRSVVSNYRALLTGDDEELGRQTGFTEFSETEEA